MLEMHIFIIIAQYRNLHHHLLTVVVHSMGVLKGNFTAPLPKTFLINLNKIKQLMVKVYILLNIILCSFILHAEENQQCERGTKRRHIPVWVMVCLWRW